MTKHTLFRCDSSLWVIKSTNTFSRRLSPAQPRPPDWKKTNLYRCLSAADSKRRAAVKSKNPGRGPFSGKLLQDEGCSSARGLGLSVGRRRGRVLHWPRPLRPHRDSQARRMMIVTDYPSHPMPWGAEIRKNAFTAASGDPLQQFCFCSAPLSRPCSCSKLG